MIELLHRCPWTMELAQLYVQLCRRHQGPRYNVNMRPRLRGRWTLSNLWCFWCARSQKCHISSAATALIGPRTLFFHFLPPGHLWLRFMCAYVCKYWPLCDASFTLKRLQICGRTCPVSEFMSASLEIQHSYVNTTYLFIYLKICIRPSEPACLVEGTPA